MSFQSGASIARFLMFCYGVPNAQAIAPNYVAVFGCNTAHAPGFRAGNPNMDISFYVPLARDDGAYGVNFAQSLAYWIANHPDWIAYQADMATPAYQFGSPAIPLNLNNGAVQAYQVASYGVPAAASGAYSSIAVDNVALTNYSGFIGVYPTATPGNQYGGAWQQLFTGVSNQPQYATAVTNWLQSFGPMVRALSPSLKMVSNFAPGVYGFSSAQALSVLASSDGLVAEFGFTSYGTANQSGSAWLSVVAWMKAVQAVGKPIYVVNQLPYPTVQADIDFAFASYLMGKYGAAALYICPQSSPGNPLYGSEHNYPHYGVNLGLALSDMFASQGVYVRKFTYGRAVVNPDPVNTHIFFLPNGITYTDVYGNSYTGSLSMAPLTGVTLLNPLEFEMSNGVLQTDDRGEPVLGLYSDVLKQVLPVYVSSTILGADGKTYAQFAVTAASNPNGQATMIASQPVVLPSDQTSIPVKATISQGNVVDVTNSSTTPLAANGVYAGNSASSIGFSALSVEVFADQVSAAGGLSIQQSSDGTNWDIKDTFSVAASTTSQVTVQLVGQFYKVQLTNGTTIQGTLRLQTVKLTVAPTPRVLIKDIPTFTQAGEAFSVNARGVTATNTNLTIASLSIFNPAGSGKNIIIYSLKVLTGTTGTSMQSWRYVTTDPSGGAGFTAIVSQFNLAFGSGQPPSVASLSGTPTGASVATTTFGSAGEEYLMAPNVSYEVLDNGAVICLAPGNGIIVYHLVGSAGSYYQACAKWREK